jgi:hypothetical protein
MKSNAQNRTSPGLRSILIQKWFEDVLPTFWRIPEKKNPKRNEKIAGFDTLNSRRTGRVRTRDFPLLSQSL